ncbi:MAG TPA: MopE-related protein, partial [Polyangiaceae bacterium]
MRFRIERSNVWDAPAARIAIALTGALGLWPACSGDARVPGPAASPSGAGGASAGSALGYGGSAGHSDCSPPSSCGTSGNHGFELALGGAPSSGGGASEAGHASDLCQAPSFVAPGCVAALASEEALCNGLDDDCDGSVDEGCPCTAGAVQTCFLGAPGRRGVGACVAGTQTCMRGVEFAAYWGDCLGGIRPSQETCDGLDNDCNGCADDLSGCTPQGRCPGPNDPRTPAGAPLTPYLLHGQDFFTAAGATWSWTIQGGPCDALTPTSPSFTLTGANTENPTFT